MKTIPQIRERVSEIGRDLGIPELVELAELMRRRPLARPRTRKLYPVLSVTQEAEIRDYANYFSEVGYRELANTFETSIGRVSEALRGKRQDA